VVALRRTAMVSAKEGGAGGGLGIPSPPWEVPALSDPQVRSGICYNSYILFVTLKVYN